MKAYLKSFTLSPFNALGSLVFFCALIPSDFRGDILRSLSWFWLTWTKRESLWSQGILWSQSHRLGHQMPSRWPVRKSTRRSHPGSCPASQVLECTSFVQIPKKQEQSHSQAIFLHIFLILWAAPLVHYPTRLWSPLLKGPDEGEGLYKTGLAMCHRWHVLFLNK